MSNLMTAFIALIPSVGLLSSAWVATSGLRLKREMDSTERFLDVVALATARPLDGRPHAGLVDQLAAIQMVAELGRRHRWLKEPARASLDELLTWSGDETKDKVAAGARSALRRL